MAGLCKPYAAYALVKALRDEVGVPIHFHTHDTSGINAASVLRAADAGVDIADAAIASMSGMTSQPNLNSLVAALRHTERDTGLDQAALDEHQPLLGGGARALLPVRRGAQGAGVRTCISTRCPAASTRTCSSRPRAWASSDRWQEICDAYAAANQLLRRHRQGDAVEQGRRRPGAVHGHQRPDGGRRPRRRRRRCTSRRASSR